MNMGRPMIYTVECSFADPASEAEWNDFYSLEKLPALISVSGFHTSQRFKAISEGCPVYLALHTVDNLDVLTSDAYRQKGGGNFAKWQQHITDWHRNLYSDIGPAPAVGMNERLAVSAHGPDVLAQMGIAPQAMQAVALEMSPVRRWLAVVPGRSVQIAEDIAARDPRVQLYVPMAAQLTSVND